MLQLSRIVLVKILTLIVVAQYVDGNQNIVHVTDTISNEDFLTSYKHRCCEYRNCSLDQALANLTSNVLINITTDVTLSTIITASNLVNVSIIGNNYPSVNCKSVGGMHFTLCRNCIIQGIIWDGCGSHAEPVLKFSHSINVTIQNCMFQHLIGQAVVLSGVLQDVNINNCKFINNSEYKGHGAAIQYSSNNTRTSFIHVVTVSGCNFSYNKMKSVIYLANTAFTYDIIIFINSIFYTNQGISLYAIRQNIFLNGIVSFQNNFAESGTGIYIKDYSSIIFDKNSNVTFIQNSANYSGGAIFLTNHSACLFDYNSFVTFNDNNATRGIIYSDASSNVTFKANSAVAFYNNLVKMQGAAIYSTDNSYVLFKENAKVTFVKNNVTLNDVGYFGGTIYSNYNSYIYFQGNSTTIFSMNHARIGGAIYAEDYSYVSFKENSTTMFKNNTADYGGAISTYNNSYINLQGSSTTVFSNNVATGDGGAICCGYLCIASFTDNSTTIFNHNTADISGGAICSELEANILLEGSSTTMFINNAANHGGGIYATNLVAVLFRENSTTMFTNNTAHDLGTVYVQNECNIIFDNNSSVTFTATSGVTVFSDSSSKIIAQDDFSVIFNDLSAKWCNSTCLSYTDHFNSIVVDSDGMVWCNNHKGIYCLSSKCYCKNLEDILQSSDTNDSTQLHVNISDKVVVLSSSFQLQGEDISIIGHNNPTVLCVNGGRLALTSSKLFHHGILTIEGITWIGCGTAEDPLLIEYTAVLTIIGYNNVTIQNCSFQYSLKVIVSLLFMVGHANINDCKFANTGSSNNGTAIVLYTNPKLSDLVLTIENCCFYSNKGIASLINIESRYQINVYLVNSVFHNNKAVSIYLFNPAVIYDYPLSNSYFSTLHIKGEVLFESNMAGSGAGIFINGPFTVTFSENSTTKFVNNIVDHIGAAVYLTGNSSVIFDSNSIVIFSNNRATNGTIYSEANSSITFKASCQVIFSDNSVTHCGSAIYSADHSRLTFKGSSKIMFNNNIALSSNSIYTHHSGTIFSENVGYISFEENSVTLFNDNLADYGAAIYSINNSNIIFKDRSMVDFNNHIVHYCGVLTSVLFSNVTFADNSNVTFNTNAVSHTIPDTYESSAGAICTFQNCNIIISGNSLVIFTKNKADRGGAVLIDESNVIIKEYSTVLYYNNYAWYSSGGAFVCSNNSTIMIEDNSNVTLNSNEASKSGGTIYAQNKCKIKFKDNSSSIFINNIARDNGGAIFSCETSKIMFEGNSKVVFNNNMANSGGALYFANNSDCLLSDFADVSFHYNTASYGAAILASVYCNITLIGQSTLLIAYNKAIQSGGGGYLKYNCNFIIQGNASVTIDSNRALHGGGICTENEVELLFKENSTAFFYNNMATVGGGAVKILNDSIITAKDYATINFINNNAQYGGAIFLDTTAVVINSSNKTGVHFANNIAKLLGNSVYQEATEFCNSSCIYDINRTLGITNQFIATPPNKLRFHHPAVCIDDENDTQCRQYFVQSVMLGKKIMIPACVLDYYNNTVHSTQFLVQNEKHPNFLNSGPKQVLISCDQFEGTNIMSNQSLSTSANFSINVTLNVAFNANWKHISVNLIIELSPCHPGFWQYPNSTKCECYNANDIVFCSGSSSTIKRGYWFGRVMGKPTVVFCPINYCNFSCCETSNGYYHLSPIRDNQCRSHRSGIACGSCKEGYTLSFDSVECLDLDDCNTGQTILVLALVLLYWIVIIVAVFSLMRFKVEIGYLYAITYYYSVVDLLLNKNWYLSSILNTTMNIISSTAKMIPRFLGELCFIKNMSGIDQQFIHYIHPVAISIFLVIITVLARKSRRLSTFISKGIIRVICYLLLLSYTSVATTSLLLMRPLIFHDVDKVYTYLSPDIEYLHGRHLAYAIVAVMFTTVIVFGLPLVLGLEPLLNSKINFIKVKPLLDQFQGCYKDKYRYFAAYYMICRLVIITIMIANSSNSFILQYSLLAACVMITLIHHILKPYANSLLNDFDGAILQVLILISALPFVEFFDDSDATLLRGVTFIIVMLPLLIFITMSLMINKERIKKLPAYCYTKCSQIHLRNYNQIPLEEMEGLADEEEYVNVIDDNRRINATVCDV